MKLSELLEALQDLDDQGYSDTEVCDFSGAEITGVETSSTDNSTVPVIILES